VITSHVIARIWSCRRRVISPDRSKATRSGLYETDEWSDYRGERHSRAVRREGLKA
jgi:hypothetical protein